MTMSVDMIKTKVASKVGDEEAQVEIANWLIENQSNLTEGITEPFIEMVQKLRECSPEHWKGMCSSSLSESP
ncbi:hypothetical protein OAT13_00950 [Gammaproteobacteria bacterium]|jgi:hypothetical protein|nr:hypothetical protein [Gammaproteobacteria bacterium]|tara:strand:+ start:747 stop:962 length:216 start_codon:yes stop_codon:yes gene_type:complete